MQSGTTNVTVGDKVTDAIKIYGHYVIEDRAIPDSRDGLKPVHRRILWAMHTLGLYPNKNFKKCARVIGETLGLYHPHGDASTYGALCSLVSQRYPLVEGHGNFGNLLGDPPAAMRYTESRLSLLGALCFEDISVQSMRENYSGETHEPLILDSKLPFLLLNGSEGIAVAMTSCLPPHNLTEILDALNHLMEYPECTTDNLADILQGPDYVTGGILVSKKEDVKRLYQTGNGVLTFRCHYHFEVEGAKQLVITSFAPRFRSETFISKCRKLINEGVIAYIADESSSKNGLRIVVGFEDSRALYDKVLPQLYTSVPYNFYVVDRQLEGDLTPELLNIKQLLQRWLDFRRDVETKVINQQIADLETKLIREKTKLIISEHVADLTQVFLKAESKEDMIKRLTDDPYLGSLTREQAEYAVELKLASIASFNGKALQKRIEELKWEVGVREKRLKNIDRVIKASLKKLRFHADERRTSTSEEIPDLPGSSIERYIGASESGHIQLWQNAPTKGKNWEYGCFNSTGPTITIITKDNWAHQLRISYLQEGKQEFNQIMAIIPSSKKTIIAWNKQGYGIAITNHQKVDSYQIIKGCEELETAVGIEESDTLVITYEGLHRVFEGAKIIAAGTSRRTSKPYRIQRTRKFDGIYVIPEGGALLNSRGRDITKQGGTVAHVVGSHNFVILTDGSRKMWSRDEVTKSLRMIKRIFPIG